MVRRRLGIIFVLTLLCGCAGPPAPTGGERTPSASAGRRSILGSARGANGNVVQVNKIERLSATEARATVRLFNPGAVPISTTTRVSGPKDFFVMLKGSNQLPVPAVDLTKSTLKEKVILSRENLDGVLYLKIPGPGPAELLYGDDAELAVPLVMIPAEK